MTLSLEWSAEGRRSIRMMHDAMRVLGPARFGQVGARVVNRTGDMARTQVRRTLPRQTGLTRRVIVRAVHTFRASSATLAYTMTAHGGRIALKHFKARETRRGVSAAPRGERQVFAGTFMKGGRFPARVPLGMGGHVFERSGSARLPIEKVRSDVSIPEEMVTGATADAFERTARTVLPQRLRHELLRATGRVFS